MTIWQNRRAAKEPILVITGPYTAVVFLSFWPSFMLYEDLAVTKFKNGLSQLVSNARVL